MEISMLGHKRIPSREGGVEIGVEKLSLSTRMAQLEHRVNCYNRRGYYVYGKEYARTKLKRLRRR